MTIDVCVVSWTGCITFFTDLDDPNDYMRKARAKYLGEHRPASTAVCVVRLVDAQWIIGIDAIALVP
jgi:hypothetical protein